MDNFDDAVTEIIPINEFGALAELGFRHNAAFDTEAQVLHAPELDDLHDQHDPIPRELRMRDEFRSSRSCRQHAEHRGESRVSGALAEVINAPALRGRHRRHLGAAGGAARARLIIAAMAVGATAAATNSVLNPGDARSRPTELAADGASFNGAVDANGGVQVVTVAATAVDAAVHSEELTHGAEFAQQRAQREARLQRPLYVPLPPAC